MKVIAAVLATALSIASGLAHAGPCTDEIARFEQEVRQAAGNPDAGPTATQTLGAQLHRQPTPESVDQAKVRARTSFEENLMRAQRLDAEGDSAGCTEALAAARRMYILSR
jgi:hypothetical protein